MLEFIMNEQVTQILIALLIFLISFLLRSVLTYIVLKIFNWKKSKQEIKEMALYTSIEKFIGLLGLYAAIIYLKIPTDIMEYITKAFKILTIFIFTVGFANSISAENSFLQRLQNKMEGENTDGMLNVLAKTLKVVIYIIGGFLIITELGYNLGGLATGLGLGTVVLTLAAQDTAKSLFSGLLIATERPFIVGDWISIGTYAGKVEAVSFRSTRIRTMDNTVIYVPNTYLVENALVNETKKKKFVTNLTFPFDTPLEKLKDMSEKITFVLQHNKGIIAKTVTVRFRSIDDSGYRMNVTAVTTALEYRTFLRMQEEINYQIMEIINNEHAELAYPSSTVYVKNDSNEE